MIVPRLDRARNIESRIDDRVFLIGVSIGVIVELTSKIFGGCNNWGSIRRKYSIVIVLIENRENVRVFLS